MRPTGRPALIAVVVLLAASECAPAAEIHIDQAAMDLIVAAHETAFEAFNRGRMRVRYIREIPPAERVLTVEGVWTWDGDSIYAEYSRNETIAGKTREEQIGARIIETPRERLSYIPAYRFAARNPPQARNLLADEFRLLPRECWWVTNVSSRRKWVEMLDPSLGGEFVKSHTLLPIEPMVVELRRTLTVGASMSARFDLEQGGNVVSCHCVHPQGLVGSVTGEETATWSWLPDGRGQFRLDEHTWESVDGGETLARDHLQVLEFDPNPVIDPELFTLKSLRLEPGTMLEDRTTPSRKRRVVGNPRETLVDEARLNRIAEELRGEGFSARNRAD